MKIKVNDIVIEMVGHIINSMRTTGIVEVVEQGVSPLDTCNDVVYNCGTCEKDLVVGEHSYTIIDPYYYFGNKYEIERIINEKNAFNNRKYPCIILEMPFSEKINDGINTTTLRFLIVNHTSEENGGKRYQEAYKEQFKKVLYPIYNDFLKALDKSKFVMSYEIINKYDRPLFGETSLVSTDYWDAIDLIIKIDFTNGCEVEICEQLIYN